MNTTPQINSVQMLAKPLDEFFFRIDAPINLSRTFNRLLFEGLRLGIQLQADELENVHALADFLLACQQAQSATIVVAEA